MCFDVFIMQTVVSAFFSLHPIKMMSISLVMIDKLSVRSALRTLTGNLISQKDAFDTKIMGHFNLDYL